MTSHPTRGIDTSCALMRPTVPDLDAILGHAFPILDHGFVRVVDYLGNDAAVVQAARVSYGHGTKTTKDDAGLINYLMRHQHTTPFEMVEIKLHVKLPVFVARQWIRHRTASVNEYSARYSILDREFYIPEPDQVAIQSTSNNQGRSQNTSDLVTQSIIADMHACATNAFDLYEDFLNPEVNLARELARTVLPMSTYTQWYWKTNLHNLLHFCRLRADPHAQYEIRVYAEAIEDIVSRWVPLAYQAYTQYQKQAMSFSGKETRVLSELLGPSALAALQSLQTGETLLHPEDPLFSKGEWQEFQAKIGALIARSI